MSLYQIFDLFLRKIISVLYRFLLVAFSVSVLLRNNNFFEWYFYLFITIGYLFIYLLLFRKEGFLSTLRLIVDFVFILIVLYKKDINNFHSMTLVFLPLINSANHSSHNRPRTSPLILYLLTFLLLFILRDFTFVKADLVALIAIWIVNIFLYARLFLIKKFNEIDEVINKFYLRKLQIGKVYTLLREVKAVISSNPFITFIISEPLIISVFRVNDNNKLSLISSSDFIYKYEVTDNSDFLKSTYEKNYISNFKITFGNGLFKPNIALKLSNRSIVYVFVVTTSESIDFHWRSRMARRIYMPTFKKVSQFLDIENEIIQEKKEYVNKMKKKMIFVDSTIKAIHFLNNRLTPISNYFDLLRKVNTIENEEERRSINEIISREGELASKNIDVIIDRMKRTLEKSNNPYIISSNENIGIQKFFSVIRKNWQESNLDESNLILDCDESFLKRVININSESFDFVLDELISNMLKYSNNFQRIDIYPDADFLIVRLTNDIKDYPRVVEGLNAVLKNFNSDDLNEILRKSSYGLSYVKDSLKQMNIAHSMELGVDKNMITLLKINTHIYNENTIV